MGLHLVPWRFDHVRRSPHSLLGPCLRLECLGPVAALQTPCMPRMALILDMARAPLTRERRNPDAWPLVRVQLSFLTPDLLVALVWPDPGESSPGLVNAWVHARAIRRRIGYPRARDARAIAVAYRDAGTPRVNVTVPWWHQGEKSGKGEREAFRQGSPGGKAGGCEGVRPPASSGYSSSENRL